MRLGDKLREQSVRHQGYICGRLGDKLREQSVRHQGYLCETRRQTERAQGLKTLPTSYTLLIVEVLQVQVQLVPKPLFFFASPLRGLPQTTSMLADLKWLHGPSLTKPPLLDGTHRKKCVRASSQKASYKLHVTSLWTQLGSYQHDIHV